MTDVIVVGAGVGGLAAALRLQALGHRVTVLEQSDRIGGKLGVEERDGFVFDTGPSLVTMPQILRDLFAAGGAALDEVLPLARLDIAARYRFPDYAQLDLPGELSAIPDALDTALGPGRGAQWIAFLQRAQSIWDLTHHTFLESPIGASTMLRAARPADVATIAPWQTLRGLGRQYLHDPRLRMLLDRYATYTGSDPRRAPAALAAVPWAEQAWGSWYVPGGLGRIATAIRDRFERLGGTVETGCAVTEITVGDRGHVNGVILADGTHRRAALVVANTDAEQMYGTLLRTRSASKMLRRIRRAAPSLSGFVLMLAVDHPPADQPHHHVLFAEDYHAEFDSVFGRNGPPRLVERPTVYLSAPADPSTVPRPGTGAWFVLVNAARHDPGAGMDWDAGGVAPEYAEHILTLMAERGLDIRSGIGHYDVLTPADLERRTLTPGGSIYGTSSNGPRAAFLRPRNASPVPGLFLVGGSAHPGGGLPLVMMSARIVAELIGPA